MHVLILGASARAAAFSARRAGLQPVAADLFADLDLKRIARAGRVAAMAYPEGLAALAVAIPAAPWMYTGSLENHPGLVDRIARQRPLWGNDGPTLRAVRDPFAVADVLRRAGLCSPEVRSDARGLPRDGSWLVKPLASAGGREIVPLGVDLDLSHRDRQLSWRSCYYQERIDGPSLAALFVAARGGGDATLAGVTRQWIGRRGRPFAYAGSLGPWPISDSLRARIEAVGRVIAAAFGLVGLFGVDLIVRAGEPWSVEVNPRYTASVEVIELAMGRSLLAEHAQACDPSVSRHLPPRQLLPRHDGPLVVGKRIVFSPTRCRFPGIDDRWMPGDDPFAVPRIGDIPAPGATFEPGDPVLTLFAQAPTLAACRLLLERRRVFWERGMMNCRSVD